jgi:hypothetical protein
MGTVNAKQVLSNLYGLMMEMNFHRADEDVLAELHTNPDTQIEKHLVKIKQLNEKLKAEANKVRFQKAIEQIRILKQKGLDEIKKLIQPQEQEQLMPLFRKFEELTKEDEEAILEDQELLHLIEILKDRIDENPE